MFEMEKYLHLILPVAVPVIAGIMMLAGKALKENRQARNGLLFTVLTAEAVLVCWAVYSGGEWTFWSLTDTLNLTFRIDGISRLFAVLTSAVWLLVGIYGSSYMSHEYNENRFFGWYLIVLGVLIGLDFSGNLITMYVFYELMTLTSLPLVLHERTHEAVMAGLKYLFYSVAGAFLALFGIFVLSGWGGTLTFAPGGILHQTGLTGKEGLLLGAVFCMLIGFGAKAGMFPLHGWLPTAHPAAPAPASAVLSGVITKSGVLAVIRVVFYVAGPDLIRGTWVQNLWIFLSLLTVFMGSMLAYKEPVLKKRLAYSTVSQVSYILFGLSVLEPTAFVGALSHIVFHSLIKNALFLCAGAVIVITGWKRVSETKGLGRVMPATLACYTAVSLGLVGIPPFSGFVSKWYLASGALASTAGPWCYIGPVVLLISALLTAGYLLPMSIQGFLPGEEFDDSILKSRNLLKREPDFRMLVPIGILTAGTLWFGLFPGSLIQMLERISASVF